MTFWLILAFIAGIACGVIGTCFNFMWAAEAGE